MRISAILISAVILLLSGITSVTCTNQETITAVQPVSVRVRSVPPARIPPPSSSGRRGSYGSSGGRYSSGGK